MRGGPPPGGDDATRCLVTGAAGFIGSHLVEALVTEGHSVAALDDLSGGREANLAPWRDRVAFVRGDVRDPEALAAAGAGAEVAFHLAAVASVPASLEDPAHTHDVNVGGTLALLLFARRAGIRRIVFASSCAVYGSGSGARQREDDPPRPLSPYAASKLAAEAYLLAGAACFGVEAVCLRLFNVFGPRQSPATPYAGVIPRFAARLCRGEPAVIHGDGTQTRDFISVRDVARAFVLAAGAPLPDGALVVNVGSGRPRSINELAAAVAAACGASVPPVHAPPRPGDVPHSGADTERARSALGFSAREDFGAALREVVDWVRRAQAPAEGGDPEGGCHRGGPSG